MERWSNDIVFSGTFLGDNSGSVGVAKTPPKEMNCVQHVISYS